MNCPNWGNWTFFASQVLGFCCLTREKHKKLKKNAKGAVIFEKTYYSVCTPEFIPGF